METDRDPERAWFELRPAREHEQPFTHILIEHFPHNNGSHRTCYTLAELIDLKDELDRYLEEHGDD